MGSQQDRTREAGRSSITTGLRVTLRRLTYPEGNREPVRNLERGKSWHRSAFWNISKQVCGGWAARAARKPGGQGGRWLAQSTEMEQGLRGRAEGKELRSTQAAETGKSQQWSG